MTKARNDLYTRLRRYMPRRMAYKVTIWMIKSKDR